MAESNVSNPKGRLTTGSTTAGSLTIGNYYSYDPMGRISTQRMCLPHSCSNTSAFSNTYSYNYVGGPISFTNNKGLSLSYDYNDAAQLVSVTNNNYDSTHPQHLLSGVQYNALGQMTSGTIGDVINSTRAYNPRGWPTQETDQGYTYTNPTSGSGALTINRQRSEPGNTYTFDWNSRDQHIDGRAERSKNNPCDTE